MPVVVDRAAATPASMRAPQDLRQWWAGSISITLNGFNSCSATWMRGDRAGFLIPASWQLLVLAVLLVAPMGRVDPRHAEAEAIALSAVADLEAVIAMNAVVVQEAAIAMNAAEAVATGLSVVSVLVAGSLIAMVGLASAATGRILRDDPVVVLTAQVATIASTEVVDLIVRIAGTVVQDPAMAVPNPIESVNPKPKA